MEAVSDLAGRTIWEEVKQDIENYDAVYLMDCGELLQENLKIISQIPKRIKLYISDKEEMGCTGVDYRRLTDGEMEDLLNLYYMYEFSDRFRVISRNPLYGTLFNYVNTGWLSQAEVFEVMMK